MPTRRKAPSVEEKATLLSKAAPGRAAWAIACAVVIYVASGIVQPLLVDYLKYQGFMGARGPAAPVTHMGVLLNTLGMSLVGVAYLLRNPWPQLTRPQCRVIAVVCSVDVIAQSMVMYGQLRVGGGLYVLLYSSSLVWTTMLSHFVLGKELHYQQWLGVMEVMLGLVLSNVHLFLFAEPSGAGDAPSWEPLIGSCVLLCGSLCAACYFVTCEWLISGGGDPGRPARPVPHMALLGMTGVSTTILLLLYNAWLAATHGVWAVYVAPVEAAGGRWADIALVAPLLTLDNAAHAAAYFSMLHSLGAVSAGIMKGVRAVAVFCLSATIYCSVDRNQCIQLIEDGHLGTGVLKCFAMYMVVRGVFAYSVAPRLVPAEPALHESATTESFNSEFSYGAL